MDPPIEKMSVAEKLRTMEALWEDLSRTPEQVPAPEWHGEILEDRAAQIEQGQAQFTPWSSARERLLNRPE